MNILRKTLYLSVLLLFATCKNDDDTPPIEQLPEATQTGRGVFGCLVNGEPFIETTSFFNTFYQNINGEFFFGIGGETDDGDMRQIILASNTAEIAEGGTYILNTNEAGNHYADCSFRDTFLNGVTGETTSGSLTITKLDFDGNIVSGLFEFDVIHPETGELFEIREGRFDTLFTQ